MNDEQFRIFLNLLMVSDPWPLDHGQQTMNEFADEESARRGFIDWIDAHRAFVPDGSRQKSSAPDQGVESQSDAPNREGKAEGRSTEVTDHHEVLNAGGRAGQGASDDSSPTPLLDEIYESIDKTRFLVTRYWMQTTADQRQCFYWSSISKGITGYPYEEHWRDCDLCQKSDPERTAESEQGS